MATSFGVVGVESCGERRIGQPGSVGYSRHMPVYRLVLLVLMVVSVGVFIHRAAGRMAFRASFGALWFLVTRRAVLVTWIVGSVALTAVMIHLSVSAGKATTPTVIGLIGVGLLGGGGLAALAVLPFWLVSRASKPPPVLELEQDESIAAELRGNHFLNGESRGGKILITDRRLGFQPSRFSVQLDPWSIPLAAIDRVEREGMHFVRVICGSDEHWLSAQRPDALTVLGSE